MSAPRGSDITSDTINEWRRPDGTVEALEWELGHVKHILQQVLEVLTDEQRLQVYKGSTGRRWEE